VLEVVEVAADAAHEVAGEAVDAGRTAAALDDDGELGELVELTAYAANDHTAAGRRHAKQGWCEEGRHALENGDPVGVHAGTLGVGRGARRVRHCGVEEGQEGARPKRVCCGGGGGFCGRVCLVRKRL
jgi:hypothetical protein